MSKRILALALGVLILIGGLLAGCGTKPVPSGQEDDEKVIGVSLFYRRDEYYKDLDSAFLKEAKAAGVKVIIQDADSDPAKQTQQIEDFVQQKVDAIALAATDPAGMVPAIEAAVAAGIPVVTYDGDANTDKTSTFVGFDYYDDGVMVGEWTADYINEHLDGTAKIAVIDFPQSAIVCGLRAQGFIDTVLEKTDSEIVAQQDGKATRSDSMSVMENILTANPDVQIVYGINFDTAAGAKAAIEAADRKDIIVVGTAYGEEAFRALENDDPIMKAFASSSPQVQARDTIASIVKLLNGEDIPKETLSKSQLFDATTIKDYDWKAIIDERNN
ncbi:MAG: substrate-binding domain-containing protein [Clostridiales bacterium]|nr:substrate-binding domain-containing protein [Clostridiales bacterium]